MLFHDTAGRLVPRGRLVREVSYHGLTGVLPDWLPVVVGSSHHSPPSQSFGYFRISGTGTIALKSVVLDMAQFDRMVFSVDNLYFDSGVDLNPGIGFKNDAATVGVGFFTTHGDQTCRLRLLGSGQPDVAVRYSWSGAEATRHRNLSIGVEPASKAVWIAEDDQIFFYGEYPAMVLGDVRAVVDATVTGTVSRVMAIPQVRLRLEAN
jgi:hypothetical protein